MTADEAHGRSLQSELANQPSLVRHDFSNPKRCSTRARTDTRKRTRSIFLVKMVSSKKLLSRQNHKSTERSDEKRSRSRKMIGLSGGTISPIICTGHGGAKRNQAFNWHKISHPGGSSVSLYSNGFAQPCTMHRGVSPTHEATQESIT